VPGLCTPPGKGLLRLFRGNCLRSDPPQPPPPLPPHPPAPAPPSRRPRPEGGAGENRSLHRAGPSVGGRRPPGKAKPFGCCAALPSGPSPPWVPLAPAQGKWCRGRARSWSRWVGVRGGRRPDHPLNLSEIPEPICRNPTECGAIRLYAALCALTDPGAWIRPPAASPVRRGDRSGWWQWTRGPGGPSPRLAGPPSPRGGWRRRGGACGG